MVANWEFLNRDKRSQLILLFRATLIGIRKQLPCFFKSGLPTVSNQSIFIKARASKAFTSITGGYRMF